MARKRRYGGAELQGGRVRRSRRGDGLFDVFKKAFHVVNEIGKPFRGIAGQAFDKLVPGSSKYVGVGTDLLDKALGNGIRRRRRGGKLAWDRLSVLRPQITTPIRGPQIGGLGVRRHRRKARGLY